MNQKKRDIIEAAFQLFYQQGIHAVGINEIIKTAGVAKKTLYNHFVSKNELIVATIIYREQIQYHWLEHRLEQGVIGKDALLISFEAMQDWVNNQVPTLGNFRGCYFQHCCAEFAGTAIDNNELVHNHCLSYKQKVRALLKTHIDSFEEHPEKADLLLATIENLLEGAISVALVSKDSNSIENAKTCVENLLRFRR